MKTIGIVGGIGPESTIEYYRHILAAWREQRQHVGAPAVLINSIDVERVLGMAAAGESGGLISYLSESVETLAKAGAGCGLLAANTPQGPEAAGIPLLDTARIHARAIVDHALA